jgi:hypothetical protein
MAQLTKGKTFISGETVEPADMHQLVDAATISDIVNAEIKSDAAIAHSKLANITAGQVLLGNASNVPTATALTGDVTVNGSGVTAIGSSRVTTSMVADSAITAPKLSGAQTGSAPVYGCRAWVNFDGTKNTGGGAASNGQDMLIRSSGNVSRVNRISAGRYEVFFSTGMPDANYAAVASSGDLDSSTFAESTATTSRTSSSFQMYTGNAGTSGALARADVSVVVFR